MIDLYGNCTSISLVDPRRAMNNFSRGSTNSSSSRSSFRSQQNQRPWPNVPTHQIMPHTVALPPAPPPMSSNHVVLAPQSNHHIDDFSHEFSNLSVNQTNTTRPSSASPPSRSMPVARTSRSASNLNIGTVPTLRYNHGVRFQQMNFHEKHKLLFCSRLEHSEIPFQIKFVFSNN